MEYVLITIKATGDVWCCEYPYGVSYEQAYNEACATFGECNIEDVTLHTMQRF